MDLDEEHSALMIEKGDDDFRSHRYAGREQRINQPFRVLGGMFYAALTVANLLVGLIWLLYASRLVGNSSGLLQDMVQTYSPAFGEAKYRKVSIDSSKLLPSIYAGEPGPEVDNAWDTLISRINIRVSAEDLRKINRTSIPISDRGGGYWGSLEVYHHLHCLKVLRHYVAKDHYPDVQGLLPERPGDVYPEHINHCFETIRTALMCQPNLNLYTYGWRPNAYDPHANDIVENTCIDWEGLEDWLDRRTFSEREGTIRRDDGSVWTPRQSHPQGS